jgi:transcriptional regulator with XRE-family HTH domain
MLFADKIRILREEQQLPQRQLAAALEIDTPMYSRIERGERPAKREQVVKLATMFHVDQEELLTLWLASKIFEVIKDEDNADVALNVLQEEMIEYGKSKK